MDADLSVKSYAKTIKCDVTTRYIARRGYWYLVDVEFSDPTMPNGLKEICGPERDERKRDWLDTADVASASGDLTGKTDEEVAQQWGRYWDFHINGRTIVGPQDEHDRKVLRWIHDAVLLHYDSSCFTPQGG